MARARMAARRKEGKRERQENGKVFVSTISLCQPISFLQALVLSRYVGSLKSWGRRGKEEEERRRRGENEEKQPRGWREILYACALKLKVLSSRTFLCDILLKPADTLFTSCMNIKRNLMGGQGWMPWNCCFPLFHST
ncbi:uncharacterized protein LOC144040590 isoform X2 [Vanacampus margaritifer]